MSELSILELEAQTGEILPEREALSTIGSFNHNTITIHNTHPIIHAHNSSNALVLLSIHGTATSTATQTVTVTG